MKTFLIRVIFLGLASLACAAQVFPAKPVHIVVPFPAGGTVDVLGRGLGEQLSEYWGQPVIVDNRPGAGSMLATQFVQRAPADGYALLMIGPSFLVNPMVNAEARYDAARDFAPVALAVTSPLVVAVNASSTARSIADLAELSKANAGKLSFGGVGPGSSQQMVGEMLKRDAKIDWVYAPYAGGAPAVTALMGNHVTGVVANYSEVVTQVQAGKLRVIAVGTGERMDSLKDVPTLAELGYDAVPGVIWFGVVVPAGTPPAVMEKVQAGIARALKVPAVREKLVGQGLYPAEPGGESFGSFLRAQSEKYERAVKAFGIKVQ